MKGNEPARLFRGSELPRLLVLLVIAAAGWAWVWGYLRAPAEPAEPDPVVAGPPTAWEPDRSAEFETVTDKTPLSFRDNAAYAKLLDAARHATPADLAARGRRDVFFTHLWEQPGAYRGVPIHLLGTARRVLYYKSTLSRTGWLYEAWVVTPDSQNHPYVCVFEEAPKGLPVGPNVSERVVFNGYFLKLMRYEAGDVPRAAPLLVGRIGWTPREGGAKGPNRNPAFWLATAVAGMFVVSLLRWIRQLRRSLTPGPRPAVRDRPNEEIDPEALAAWVENAAEDRDEAPRDPSS